jgi:hypothetical protein
MKPLGVLTRQSEVIPQINVRRGDGFRAGRYRRRCSFMDARLVKPDTVRFPILLRDAVRRFVLIELRPRQFGDLIAFLSR